MRHNFFQDLGENIYSLQPASKSNAPGLKPHPCLFILLYVLVYLSPSSQKYNKNKAMAKTEKGQGNGVNETKKSHHFTRIKSYYTWASATGARGGRGLPRIFKHGTNIVNRGLKVLFSAFFCYFTVIFSVAPPPPLKNFLPTPLLLHIFYFEIT